MHGDTTAYNIATVQACLLACNHASSAAPRFHHPDARCARGINPVRGTHQTFRSPDGIDPQRSAIQRYARPPEQRIGRRLERPDHRPNAATLDQLATRARLPDATGTLDDVRQFPRAGTATMRPNSANSTGPMRAGRGGASARGILVSAPLTKP